MDWKKDWTDPVRRLIRLGERIAPTVHIEDFHENGQRNIKLVHRKCSTLLRIPIFEQISGIWYVGNYPKRVASPVLLKDHREILEFPEFLNFLIFSAPVSYFGANGKSSMALRILRSFLDKDRDPVQETRIAQAYINRALSQFALAEHPMRDWSLSHRVMIFDAEFDKVKSIPDRLLKYQREKNRKMFPWSSIGISDGAAATKNYILRKDLRDTIPFGKYHRPIRNLYSTLATKGEETPQVLSSTAKELQDRGIKRKGFNWVTVFLDLPDNFEDQILVSNRHADKFVAYEVSRNVYGQVKVEKGNWITSDTQLNDDDSFPVFPDARAEKIQVKDIVQCIDTFDIPYHQVILECHYQFKDGFKISNQHGNKGIIRLMDLGWVEDPVKGRVPIDVICSAKSIKKRGNFGQVLESQISRLHGREVVIPNDYKLDLDKLSSMLEEAGYSPDGTMKAVTPWGEFTTLTGKLFWGVTKTPENQPWEKMRYNEMGLTTGVKYSLIDFRGLFTQFGVKSPVIREILKYRSGLKEVKELLWTLSITCDHPDEKVSRFSPSKFCYRSSMLSYLTDMKGLCGTVADPLHIPSRFYLELPIQLAYRTEPDGSVTEGHVGTVANPDRTFSLLPVISFGSLRGYWQHQSGQYAMTPLAQKINAILEAIDLYNKDQVSACQLSDRVWAYLRFITRLMSGKSGYLNNYVLSVRYPRSDKAVASLDSQLPKNWVAIHRSMANRLQISDGDYCLIERFPCLGFFSIRVQRVKVVDDPQCRYTIRVSGNSLVSTGLDFDGDVIYISSFPSPECQEELQRAFHRNDHISELVETMNSRKQPCVETTSIPKLQISPYPDMSPDEHADLNATSLAVKVYTGPVIALCFNMCRLAEGWFPLSNSKIHANVEFLLHKIGNSVFSQKHGSKSLREKFIKAVCLADAELMQELGVSEEEAKLLSRKIIEEAKSIGIYDLHNIQKQHEEEGRSSLLSLLIRRNHRFYFATRAELHPVKMMEHLESPGKMDLALVMGRLAGIC